MNVSKLIALCEAKLANLHQLRTSAERSGDIDRMTSLEAEIAETEHTLESLRSLE